MFVGFFGSRWGVMFWLIRVIWLVLFVRLMVDKMVWMIVLFGIVR